MGIQLKKTKQNKQNTSLKIMKCPILVLQYSIWAIA